jgi:hypothetical protein
MLKVAVLSIGVINIPSGQTMYNWSIYENLPLTAYLTSNGFLVLGDVGSLKVGDELCLVGNDSGRKLKETRIISECNCDDRKLFMDWLYQNGYDYKPLRPFQKRRNSNRKLITSYVLK